MRIQTKLILGFFLISLFVIVIGLISLRQISKIAAPLHKEVPNSIEELNKADYLDGLAQFIRYYDEVLTQSARNYAFTQNEKWEQRYRDIEPQLDKIIKETIEKGDETEKEFFRKVDEANIALVKMEYDSINYVSQGKSQEAVKILESSEYWAQKRIYEQGLRDYVAKRGSKYEEALVSSTQVLDSTTKSVANISSASNRLISILIMVSFAISIALGILISRIISKPLVKLEEAISEIARGNTDFRVDIKTKDEIGALAMAFNSMADQLKDVKKNEKKQKFRKELDALEASYKTGFISKESYEKERKRLEEGVIRLGGVSAEILKEKGFIKKED